MKGIQDQGVMANAKHWVNNEIEDHRDTVSANVDERTRFELYYPPFEAAIKAGVYSAMCSYNRINDDWGCQNADTISHLKENLGFNGWLMSDWTATHSTVDALNSGLDQEMPLALFFNEEKLQAALDNGEIEMSTIDESVTRILTAMYSIGLFDNKPTGDRNAIVTSEEHNKLARLLAATSTVLLKNDGNLLPLQKSSLRSVAVIGEQIVSGSGSGHVTPGYTISVEDGIANALSAYNVTVTYNSGSDIDAAVTLAASSDVVVVLVGTSSGEGKDRETLSLGADLDNLVTKISSANARTIVSVNSPGAVLMPWAKDTGVASILMSWLPGQVNFILYLLLYYLLLFSYVGSWKCFGGCSLW